MTPLKRRENQRKNQDYFSEKISELCRYIGFGTVAAAFSLFSDNGDFAHQLIKRSDSLLGWSAVTACIALLLDYLQMVAGYWSAADAAENEVNGFCRSKFGNLASKIQRICFTAKQPLAAAGGILLVVAIARYLPLPWK